MKARVLQTKFWQDSFVSDLSPGEKLVFIYLMSNDRVNIIHCYECSDRVILFDTGVSKDTLASCKNKLQATGKVRFFRDYVHLVNADRYQHFIGEKNEQAKKNILREMSDDVIAWYESKSDTPIDTPIEGVYIPPITSNHNHNHKKGGVGGNKPLHKTLDYLAAVPQEEAEALAKRHDLSVEAVRSKADDLHNYCLSKGKKYDDYRAFLSGAVRRDKDKLKQTTPGFLDIDAMFPKKG